MLPLMIRHECRLLVRGRAFWICTLLLTAVTMFAVRNGAAWVDQQHATIAAIDRHDDQTYRRVKEELVDLARRGDPRPTVNVAGMAWYLLQPGGVPAPAPAPHIDPRRPEAAGSEWVGARYAVLPPAPLGALSIGQSDVHPYYSRVTIRTQPVLIHSDEIENPVNLVSGRFDVAFVLTFCWPLLVLPLAYDLLSEERDNGTLALLLSQPISVGTVLLAKLIVRGGSMVLVTSLASLAALIGLANISVDASTAVGLAGWIALIVANGLLWFGLAAWVNSRGWRSGVNAMALTAAWLGWLVVIPTIVGLLATSLAPVPSRVQLINEVRTAGNLAPPELARLLTTYQEEHPDVAPLAGSADTTAVRGLALQDETDHQIAPVLARYRDALQRQQQLVGILRFASPAILTYDIATELAGTSTTRYRRFADQLADYHRAWRDYFYPLVHRRVWLTPDDYDRAPRFTFREDAPATLAIRVLVPLITIAALGIVMLAASLGMCSRRLSIAGPISGSHLS